MPVAGRQPSGARHGEGAGPPRGLRAGHASIGVARERGRALCLLAHMPGLGARAPKGPGVRWALRPEHAPTWDPTNARQQARYRGARDKRSDPRGAERQSERSRGPLQVGHQGPRAPLEGRRRRASRGAGQTAGRDLALTNRHTKTPAPCGAGRPRAQAGVDDPSASDRRRLAARGVLPDEQVACRGDGRGPGHEVCRAPRRQPARLGRASPEWRLSGGARGACRDRDGRRWCGSTR